MAQEGEMKVVDANAAETSTPLNMPEKGELKGGDANAAEMLKPLNMAEKGEMKVGDANATETLKPLGIAEKGEMKVGDANAAETSKPLGMDEKGEMKVGDANAEETSKPLGYAEKEEMKVGDANSAETSKPSGMAQKEEMKVGDANSAETSKPLGSEIKTPKSLKAEPKIVKKTLNAKKKTSKPLVMAEKGERKVRDADAAETSKPLGMAQKGEMKVGDANAAKTSKPLGMDQKVEMMVGDANAAETSKPLGMDQKVEMKVGDAIAAETSKPLGMAQKGEMKVGDANAAETSKPLGMDQKVEMKVGDANATETSKPLGMDQKVEMKVGDAIAAETSKPLGSEIKTPKSLKAEPKIVKKTLNAKKKGSQNTEHKEASNVHIKKKKNKEGAETKMRGQKDARNTQKFDGRIFLCNAKTKPECFRYMVMGLPQSKKEIVAAIEPGMKLFLYDLDAKLVHGIYEATSSGGMNLEQAAFNGLYPAQVRFKVHMDCMPISEESFKKAILGNADKIKFKKDLSVQQVKELTNLFQPSAHSPQQVPTPPAPLRPIIPEATAVQPTHNSQGKKRKLKVKCYNCKKWGHFASECRYDELKALALKNIEKPSIEGPLHSPHQVPKPPVPLKPITPEATVVQAMHKTKKRKWVRCFNCNKWGHIAEECKLENVKKARAPKNIEEPSIEAPLHRPHEEISDNSNVPIPKNIEGPSIEAPLDSPQQVPTPPVPPKPIMPEATEVQATPKVRNRKWMKCFNCRQYGHIAEDCKSDDLNAPAPKDIEEPSIEAPLHRPHEEKLDYSKNVEGPSIEAPLHSPEQVPTPPVPPRPTMPEAPVVQATHQSQVKKRKLKVKCFNCGKWGHVVDECKYLKNTEGPSIEAPLHRPREEISARSRLETAPLDIPSLGENAYGMFSLGQLAMVPPSNVTYPIMAGGEYRRPEAVQLATQRAYYDPYLYSVPRSEAETSRLHSADAAIALSDYTRSLQQRVDRGDYDASFPVSSRYSFAGPSFSRQ